MQKNYATIVMAVKLSANIPLQSLWCELTYQADRSKIVLQTYWAPSRENLPVIVDYYSSYFEVVILRSTTSTKVIESLQPIFTRLGVPHTFKKNNGPQFISKEFKAFHVENGIEHQTTPSLWPQANGEVERQNRTLLKVIQVAQIKGKDWRQESQIFNYAQVHSINDNWCGTILLNVRERNAVDVARVKKWGTHHQSRNP